MERTLSWPIRKPPRACSLDFSIYSLEDWKMDVSPGLSGDFLPLPVRETPVLGRDLSPIALAERYNQRKLGHRCTEAHQPSSERKARRKKKQGGQVTGLSSARRAKVKEHETVTSGEREAKPNTDKPAHNADATGKIRTTQNRHVSNDSKLATIIAEQHAGKDMHRHTSNGRPRLSILNNSNHAPTSNQGLLTSTSNKQRHASTSSGSTDATASNNKPRAVFTGKKLHTGDTATLNRGHHVFILDKIMPVPMPERSFHATPTNDVSTPPRSTKSLQTTRRRSTSQKKSSRHESGLKQEMGSVKKHYDGLLINDGPTNKAVCRSNAPHVVPQLNLQASSLRSDKQGSARSGCLPSYQENGRSTSVARQERVVHRHTSQAVCRLMDLLDHHPSSDSHWVTRFPTKNRFACPVLEDDVIVEDIEDRNDLCALNRVVTSSSVNGGSGEAVFAMNRHPRH